MPTDEKEKLDLRRAMAKVAMAREAAAAQAAEHSPACGCLACRATAGDMDAFEEVIRLIDEGSPERISDG